jgi:hypothetical protein
MSISRNGTCVNTPDAPRLTVLSLRHLRDAYTVHDPEARSFYGVYLGGMSRCECGSWARLGRCTHIEAARAFRDAELYQLETPKPKRLSTLAVKRRPSTRESMAALEAHTRKAAEANALRAEMAREWDAILGSDGGA